MPFARCFEPVDSDITERQEARIVQSWLNLDDFLPRFPFSECGRLTLTPTNPEPSTDTVPLTVPTMGAGVVGATGVTASSSSQPTTPTSERE